MVTRTGATARSRSWRPRPRRAGRRRGVGAGPRLSEARQREQAVGGEQRDGAEEPPRFGEGGEDEVRVSLRQEGEAALGAPEEPLAHELAGSNRDLRLNDVPRAAERIPERIEVDQEPLTLIVAQEEPEGRGGGEAASHQDRQVAPARAADEGGGH